MREWERIDPGHYTSDDLVILRLATHRWELSGMVRDTTTHRTLREAKLAAEHG